MRSPDFPFSHMYSPTNTVRVLSLLQYIHRRSLDCSKAVNSLTPSKYASANPIIERWYRKKFQQAIDLKKKIPWKITGHSSYGNHEWYTGCQFQVIVNHIYHLWNAWTCKQKWNGHSSKYQEKCARYHWSQAHSSYGPHHLKKVHANRLLNQGELIIYISNSQFIQDNRQICTRPCVVKSEGLNNGAW